MSNYNCRRYKETEGGAISHLCTSNCTKMYTQNYIWCIRSTVISWIPIACNAKIAEKWAKSTLQPFLTEKESLREKAAAKWKLEFTSTEMYVTLLAKQPELVGVREKNNFVLWIKVFSVAFIIIFKPWKYIIKVWKYITKPWK